MQRPVWLAGIPEIVFKLGMQFGAYFAIFAETFFVARLLSLCTHVIAKLRG